MPLPRFASVRYLSKPRPILSRRTADKQASRSGAGDCWQWNPRCRECRARRSGVHCSRCYSRTRMAGSGWAAERRRCIALFLWIMKKLPNRCHEGHQSLKRPVFTGFFRPLKLFPLGKFKYRAAYLQWFYKQNIRKYVNDLRWYLRLFHFLVSK